MGLFLNHVMVVRTSGDRGGSVLVVVSLVIGLKIVVSNQNGPKLELYLP